MHNLTWNRSICCAAAVILPPHAIIVFLPELKWNHDVLFSVWRSSPPQGAPDGICAREPATHRVRGIFTALFAQWEWSLSLNNKETLVMMIFLETSGSWFKPLPSGPRRLSLWNLHVLPTSTWGLSVYSSFLPLSTCVDITVTIGEKEWEHLLAPRWASNLSRVQPDKCNSPL